jgi:predicted  nucleic acid-binding Zn-ribbon protein
MSAATLAELQTARESAQQAASALQAAQAESANLRLQLNNVTATLSSREAQLESMSAATARLMDEMNALRAAKDAADGKAAAAERELAEERKANAAKAGKRDKAATEIAKLQVWFMFHSML